MGFTTKQNLVNSKHCQQTGGMLTLSGNTVISSGGSIQYAVDESSTFCKFSIVDKNYVTGITSTLGIQTANNGLTKNGLNVRLGGGLTGNTSITGNYSLNICNGAKLNTILGYQISGNTILRTSPNVISSIYLGDNSFNLNISGASNVGIGHNSGYNSLGSGNIFLGNCSGYNETGSNKLYVSNTNTSQPLIYGDFAQKCAIIHGAFKISGTTSLLTIPTIGSTSDSILLRANNGEIKEISSNTLLGSTISGVTNGLTKIGHTVILGGTLTGNTTISGGSVFSITSPSNIDNNQYIRFCKTPPPRGFCEGSLYYANDKLNFERDISGVTLQVGEETVVYVCNISAGIIPNGSVVYICGAQSGLPTIDKAIASNKSQAENTLGLATDDIYVNSKGYVTLMGIVNDLNTATWTAGTPLFLSDSQSGCFTCTPPSYPNEKMLVGYVTCQDSLTGAVLVSVRDNTEYVDEGAFIGYTASTSNTLAGKMTCVDFDSYTGATTPIINGLVSMCGCAITGATNGLCKIGAHGVYLGGSLTSPVTISGNQKLTLGDLNGIDVSSINGCNINLNSKSNGSIFIKSQCNTVASGSDFTCAVGIEMNVIAGGFIVHDDRCAINRTGIVYASDYSSNYVNRSLVDKAYVDSVATGLNSKTAVFVATTGNIALSGLSIVDGVQTTIGMRVLVKDDLTGWKNGIYSANTGNWGRTSDYDFTPSGEVSNGDLIPVSSGNSHANSIWIMSSQNPIISGVTNLVFTQFLQQIGITEGNGINVTTVGINKQISVELYSVNAGLCFNGTGLQQDWNIYNKGMCYNSGKVDIRATTGIASGSEIGVKINTGGTNVLYVDSSTVACCLGNPIITSNNGLTKIGSNVVFGGMLTGNTTILGNSKSLSFGSTTCKIQDFNINYQGTAKICDYNLSPVGIQYGADYSTSFITRSLVDKGYVDGKIISGVLACNGLTKVGGTVILGGQLTGNTQIWLGSGRLCFKDGGLSCVDLLSTCSALHLQDGMIYMQGCAVGSCNAKVCVTSGATISLTTNKTSCGVLITAPTTGAIYNADYSAGFINESLVSKRYVTGLTTTSGIQTANNGLTKNGTNVRLGGVLTGNTTIVKGSTTMLAFSDNGTGSLCTIMCGSGGYVSATESAATLCSSTSSISVACDKTISISSTKTSCGVLITVPSTGAIYNADYSAGFINESLVSKRYVTGITSTLGIQTANNGLTKNGLNVRLGGTLTGNTTITGNYSLNICNGAKLNTILGYQISGNTILSASPNTISSIFLGQGAGNNTSTGVNNIAIGCQTLNNNTTGCNNTALGCQALQANTTGNFNIAIGSLSLYSNTGGTNNIGIGYQSMYYNKIGCDNVAIGCQALRRNTTGCNNIALGSNALYCNTGGTDNFASGYQALYNNTKGLYNIAIGCQVLYNNTIGSNNIANGNYALYINTSGSNNIANGCCALFYNTIGCNNIANGFQTLSNNSSGNYNIANGYSALGSNTIGNNNIANGYQSLYSNTGGTNNIAFGYQSLYSNTKGNNNIANGINALWKNTFGCANIAQGCNALQNNVTGSTNIAFGANAGYNTLGNGNIFLGNCSGYNETGSNKLYVSNSSTTQPLIYGDFSSRCAIIYGAFKTSGTTSLIVAPNVGTTSDAILVRNSSTGEIKSVAGTSLGDKNNIYSKTIITGSTLLTTGSSYVILVNHSSPIILTLPSTPIDGQAFKIKDASTVGALTNNITIASNGKNIDRVLGDALINTTGGAFELFYDVTLGWFGLAFI